jgi:hypothetical protein
VVDHWVIYALEAWFGSALFLALLLALVCWLKRRIKPSQEKTPEEELAEELLCSAIPEEFYLEIVREMDAARGRTTHQKGPLT